MIIKKVLAESFVSEDIMNKRLDICRGCKSLVNDKCVECGCYVELKAAMDYNRNPKKLMRMEKTHCHRGKWVGIDEATGKEYKNDKDIANYYRELDGITLLK